MWQNHNKQSLTCVTDYYEHDIDDSYLGGWLVAGGVDARGWPTATKGRRCKAPTQVVVMEVSMLSGEYEVSVSEWIKLTYIILTTEKHAIAALARSGTSYVKLC